MTRRVMVVDVRGDVDQAGLERLRSHLRLEKLGRWSDDWDEELGYRTIGDDGSERGRIHLYRSYRDEPWKLHVVAGDPGLGAEELTRLRDELVRGITAAGFQPEVRVDPAEPTPAYPAGIASIHPAPADEDGAARRDAEASAEAARLIEPIAQELALLGPAGWDTLTATFAIAGPAEVAQLSFVRGRDATPTPVPVGVMGLVREHRGITARMSAGPWWRMRLDVDNSGRVSQRFDYGDEPFPADQLFGPEDYRDDLRAWPRRRVPLWLAGFVAGPAAQGRSPELAGTQAGTDAATGVAGVPTDDVVALEEAWCRWAVLAAVRTGLRRAAGPWMEPATASFERGEGSGSTLCILPRERAVLSGGRWNSPLLEVAYNGGGALPDLYAGAPAWVNDSTLDGRSQRGALSFCYWWHDGSWHRGAANTFDELDDPLPAIWTNEEATTAIVDQVGEDRRGAAAALVAAANARAVTMADLNAVLSDRDTDVAAAFNQLSLAGLAAGPDDDRR